MVKGKTLYIPVGTYICLSTPPAMLMLSSEYIVWKIKIKIKSQLNVGGTRSILVEFFCILKRIQEIQKILHTYNILE